MAKNKQSYLIAGWKILIIDFIKKIFYLKNRKVEWCLVLIDYQTLLSNLVPLVPHPIIILHKIWMK